MSSTPAGRMQAIMDLLYSHEEDGSVSLDPSGAPVLSGLITMQQAIELLSASTGTDYSEKQLSEVHVADDGLVRFESKKD